MINLTFGVNQSGELANRLCNIGRWNDPRSNPPKTSATV